MGNIQGYLISESIVGSDCYVLPVLYKPMYYCYQYVTVASCEVQSRHALLRALMNSHSRARLTKKLS